ncbi:hypothetical protein IFM89_014122 [Coptis chinensis]|uniref:Uncharacterized protein n=1 Tax=Coptis chinensis TaxID=261450 RepID=A0A835HSU7_9MAGN|nr:hypothetical protein IFM89_014122 [Coptis chinensis]
MKLHNLRHLTTVSSFLERIGGKIHPDLWAETKRFQQARWEFQQQSVLLLSLGGAYYALENANRASVASVTEVLEIKQNVIKESEDAEFEASHQCVFLLGENRWEDSYRLVGRNKEVSASKVEFQQQSVLIVVGRGVYYVQFLEWVDKGTKCPYCEGLGYNICDVCEGKTLIRA